MAQGPSGLMAMVSADIGRVSGFTLRIDRTFGSLMSTALGPGYGQVLTSATVNVSHFILLAD